MNSGLFFYDTRSHLSYDACGHVPRLTSDYLKPVLIFYNCYYYYYYLYYIVLLVIVIVVVAVVLVVIDIN